MVFVAENPGEQAGQAAGAAGGGEEAEGEHRPAQRERLEHPVQVLELGGVRGLRPLHQHEGEADNGRQGDRRQDKTGRGAAAGAERDSDRHRLNLL